MLRENKLKNSMPKQVLVLDSSQLSTFLECPEAWRLKNEECLTQNNEVDEPISAGTLMHKWLEIYYKSKRIGHTISESFHNAINFDPDAADKADAGRFPLSPEMRERLKKRFLDYYMTYSNSDYDVSSKKRYSICVGDDDVPHDVWLNEPLVEQGFSFKLFESNEYLFVLEGRIDFIGSVASTPLWMDHKIQFRERNLYKKSIQFKNYALVTGLPLGVINYIRMHTTLTPKTLVRSIVEFTPFEKRCWHQELIEIYIHICKEITSKRFFKNRDACQGKFGYPCQYVSLCDEYTPSVRDAVKQRDFVKIERWKPW